MIPLEMVTHISTFCDANTYKQMVIANLIPLNINHLIRCYERQRCTEEQNTIQNKFGLQRSQTNVGIVIGALLNKRNEFKKVFVLFAAYNDVQKVLVKQMPMSRFKRRTNYRFKTHLNVNGHAEMYLMRVRSSVPLQCKLVHEHQDFFYTNKRERFLFLPNKVVCTI
ncbi:hypothetical protein [Clostera anachoreta granulovirus]|uniref:Uncharacterized protein n=1 Tax=Clostera anachoreta granulovirus TaxID=283675 RepID=F4ZKR7_9BBAC|nr:hypothetical protein ClanGV_gp040 [Clostera anachoreta granulovirus]AEB00328.1 hypothetical protein [Clostera anachoreta granulovirus]